MINVEEMIEFTDSFNFKGKEVKRSVTFENGTHTIEYSLGSSKLKFEVHPTEKDVIKGIPGVEEFVIEVPIDRDGGKTALTKIPHEMLSSFSTEHNISLEDAETLLKFSIEDIKNSPKPKEDYVAKHLEEMLSYGDIERIFLINFRFPRIEKTGHLNNYSQYPSHRMLRDIGFKLVGYTVRHPGIEYPLYVLEL